MSESNEVLTAVLDLSAAVNAGFARLEGRMTGLEGRMDRLEVRVTSLESEVRVRRGGQPRLEIDPFAAVDDPHNHQARGAVTEVAIACSGRDLAKAGTDYARAFQALLDALRVKKA